jgi:hypothetical protein
MGFMMLAVRGESGRKAMTIADGAMRACGCGYKEKGEEKEGGRERSREMSMR